MAFNESKIVEFSCEQMFNLVNDIESYPDFVNFCCGSSLDAVHDDGYTARLDYQVGSFKKSFTTRNFITPHSEILIRLVSGPFKRLEGKWSFVEMGKQQCQVNLSVEYEFSSRATALALGPFFKTLPKIMLESFHREARRKYAK